MNRTTDRTRVTMIVAEPLDHFSSVQLAGMQFSHHAYKDPPKDNPVVPKAKAATMRKAPTMLDISEASPLHAK